MHTIGIPEVVVKSVWDAARRDMPDAGAGRGARESYILLGGRGLRGKPLPASYFFNVRM
jgi:hypothetical protein